MRTEIVWRPAVAEDLPRIMELWDEQEKRFAGTDVKVDRPKLFCEEEDSQAFAPYCPPVIRVAVAEEDGVISGFRYTEVVAEVAIITGSKAVMESLGTELTHEAQWAKSRGFRSGWGLVPQRFAVAMTRFLKRYPHIRVWKSLTPVGIDFSELGD
ncbi:MAG TPA: hypothetical protein VGQ12_07585 [Candidatus Angelobacter sp.]|jgi:hypothetical protein|nr:hypothetical protein [Candidatus Angelobacter sp.]